MAETFDYDVLIIGAGPAGTCAAALLKKDGWRVGIVEREVFPRFSIGESLLSQSVVYLEQAGLLDAVKEAGFQNKNGAAFLRDGKFTYFEFEDKYTPGPFRTFQVQRARFDKVLADECERKGVDIRYAHRVDAISFEGEGVQLKVTDLSTMRESELRAKFVLDGSGFGRTLPRLLKLDRPSDFPNRRAVFCHMSTNFPASFDTNKILITVDDKDQDVWLWTIPFPENTCSIGVVGTEEYFKSFGDDTDLQILQKVIAANPKLAEIMNGAQPINEARTLKGYSSAVSTLYGPRFALLGNAGEFLDPVFSSGVTIALQSASLASALITRELRGEKVDWENDFSEALKVGVKCFKTFVKTWYTGELQSIIFYEKPDPKIKRQVCSVLAGYAWDETNPYVAQSDRAVAALARMCEMG